VRIAGNLLIYAGGMFAGYCIAIDKVALSFVGFLVNVVGIALCFSGGE
jgi:uncharacterized protein YfbU (UPF0304 family)